MKPENINAALKTIEEHELVGAKIIMHPQRYKDLIDDKKAYNAVTEYMKQYANKRQDIK